MKDKKEIIKKYLDQAEKMTDRELLIALYVAYLANREYDILSRLEILEKQNEILSNKLGLKNKNYE